MKASHRSVFLFAGATEFFKETIVPKLQLLRMITILPIPDSVSAEDRIPLAKAKELYETLDAKATEIAKLGIDCEMTDESIEVLVAAMADLAEGMEEANDILITIQQFAKREMLERFGVDVEKQKGCGDSCDCCGGSCGGEGE